MSFKEKKSFVPIDVGSFVKGLPPSKRHTLVHSISLDPRLSFGNSSDKRSSTFSPSMKRPDRAAGAFSPFMKRTDRSAGIESNKSGKNVLKPTPLSSSFSRKKYHLTSDGTSLGTDENLSELQPSRNYSIGTDEEVFPNNNSTVNREDINPDVFDEKNIDLVPASENKAEDQVAKCDVHDCNSVVSAFSEINNEACIPDTDCQHDDSLLNPGDGDPEFHMVICDIVCDPNPCEPDCNIEPCEPVCTVDSVDPCQPVCTIEPVFSLEPCEPACSIKPSDPACDSAFNPQSSHDIDNAECFEAINLSVNYEEVIAVPLKSPVCRYKSTAGIEFGNDYENTSNLGSDCYLVDRMDSKVINSNNDETTVECRKKEKIGRYETSVEMKFGLDDENTLSPGRLSNCSSNTESEIVDRIDSKDIYSNNEETAVEFRRKESQNDNDALQSHPKLISTDVDIYSLGEISSLQKSMFPSSFEMISPDDSKESLPQGSSNCRIEFNRQLSNSMPTLEQNTTPLDDASTFQSNVKLQDSGKKVKRRGLKKLTLSLTRMDFGSPRKSKEKNSGGASSEVQLRKDKRSSGDSDRSSFLSFFNRGKMNKKQRSFPESVSDSLHQSNADESALNYSPDDTCRKSSVSLCDPAETLSTSIHNKPSPKGLGYLKELYRSRRTKKLLNKTESKSLHQLHSVEISLVDSVDKKKYRSSCHNLYSEHFPVSKKNVLRSESTENVAENSKEKLKPLGYLRELYRSRRANKRREYPSKNIGKLNVVEIPFNDSTENHDMKSPNIGVSEPQQKAARSTPSPSSSLNKSSRRTKMLQRNAKHQKMLTRQSSVVKDPAEPQVSKSVTVFAPYVE